MQIDPIKPTVKAPGTKLLTLECIELLSSFALNSNLRRYNKVELVKKHDAQIRRGIDHLDANPLHLYGAIFLAGAYTRSLFSST